MEVKFNVAELYLALFREAPTLKEGAGEAVKNALSDLTPRERQVLNLRFGLEDGKLRSMQDVGREFGVTKRRINDIEVQALERVRNSKHSQLLKEFIVT